MYRYMGKKTARKRLLRKLIISQAQRPKMAESRYFRAQA
jgi:hypothetical protein